MADQVNPTGALSPGFSVALAAISAPRPAQEKARPGGPAESQPAGSSRAPGSAGKVSEAALVQANNRLQQVATGLKFQVDQATGHTVLKVVNQETGEVLLQMPPEEFLAMARNLRALEDSRDASGVLVDRKG